MIDSTTNPPKEEPENVFEKRSIIAVLTSAVVACASGCMSSNPERAKPTDPAETPSTTEDAPSGENPPAPSPDSGGNTAKAKDGKPKPGRIVLNTEYDDRRVGDDQTAEVEAELGLVQDEKLLEYVRSVGIRLVRYAPPHRFDYEFRIVDQSVPNAFALPGGKIYISRGLLALVGSEDELAGVIGHEITHAAERHTAARIDYSRRLSPFSIGLMRAAAIAAYGRDQERDADQGGQILAAQAGYNPAGIATFLRKLDASDRYELGWSRLPYFLATHPTSPERSALAADRAARLVWERKPGVADDLPLGYASVIDGLIIGDNPAGGLFDESRFVHADLRFSIRFPLGWLTFNSQAAVGAVSPARDAEATLTLEGKGPDIGKVVDEFIEKEVDGTRVQIQDRREVKIGELPAIRIEGRATNGMVGLTIQMTFVAHEGLVYRLSLISLSSAASKYRGRGRAFAHSFRPLDEKGVHSLKVTRLRIARALENETLQALSLRTHNEIELVFTGVMNNIYASTELAKGRPVKIGLAEPYLPKPKEETKEDAATKPEKETEKKPEAPKFLERGDRRRRRVGVALVREPSDDVGQSRIGLEDPSKPSLSENDQPTFSARDDIRAGRLTFE